MPGQTTQGIPYPLGTDRVSDGDNAIQSVATWLDNSICSGSASLPNDTGPGVNGTMWFGASPYALHGGVTSVGTFPVGGLGVPRKGYYYVHAVGNFQVSTVGNYGRLFVGDGSNVWAQSYFQFAMANTYQSASVMTVVQLNAGAGVYWGMSSYGAQAVGMYAGVMSRLHVRLLVPLP